MPLGCAYPHRIIYKEYPVKPSRPLSIAAFVCVATTAAAAPCDTEAAASDIETAMAAGIINDAGVINGAMSIVIDAPLWDEMPIGNKLAMLQRFNCAIAGPGSLEEVVVIEPGGRVLGEWDAIRGNLVQP